MPGPEYEVLDEEVVLMQASGVTNAGKEVISQGIVMKFGDSDGGIEKGDAGMPHDVDSIAVIVLDCVTCRNVRIVAVLK